MINLDTNYVKFGYTQSSYSVMFTTTDQMTNMTVESTTTWATSTITYDPSTRDGLVTITVTQNTLDINRYALIKITGRNTVTQQQEVEYISITQTPNVFSGEVFIYKYILDNASLDNPQMITNDEHSLVVIVRYNTLVNKVEVTSTPAWITHTGKSTRPYDQEYNDEYCRFTISANDVNQPRTGDIVFTSYDYNGSLKTLTYSLTQGYDATPYIYASNMNITGDAQTVNLNIYTQNATITNITTNVSWLTLGTYDQNVLPITVTENVLDEPRVATITIYAESTIDPSVTTSATVRITQARSTLTGIVPAWKDYIVPLNLTLEDYTDIYYDVYVANKLVFKGHSYSADETTPSVNISDIVRNYIAPNFKFDGPTIQTTQFTNVKLFTNVQNTDNIQSLIADLDYYYDYSFDEAHTYDTIRNAPILDILDPRQYLIYSILVTDTDPHDIHIYHITSPQQDTQHWVIHEQPGTHYIRSSVYGERMTVTYDNTNDLSYKVVNTCSRYCLYYLNPFGGWDSLIFDGHNIDNYNYEILTKKNKFYNVNPLDYETKQYLKNITKSYKLTTRYLTDEQSSRMPYLLSSTNAYLHDLVTDRITPVLINNKSTNIKTFRNMGHKLYTYTIEVTESQNTFTR